MRITALLPTHDLPEQSMPWMMEARKIFDELVIFIDEKRVTPGTVTRAERVGTRVHYHRADTWYEWDLGAMARQCESDWVFIIERDEQLSGEWQQAQWPPDSRSNRAYTFLDPAPMDRTGRQIYHH